MRKLILSAAALAVLGLTAISFTAPAKADPLIVVGGGHHHHNHDHDRNVIIKKNGY